MNIKQLSNAAKSSFLASFWRPEGATWRTRHTCHGRPRLTCEGLEQRRVLSANTIAELIGGQLVVTGDDADNSVEIIRQDLDEITDPTILPHISIEGTGDGTFDYYSFTVSEAGSKGVFDVDHEGFLDSALFLFDEAGNQIAYNDDFGGFSFIADPGSDNSFSALLQYYFPVEGVYTIGVGKWYSFSDGGELTGTPLDEGDEYTLHISLENHALNEEGENVISEVEANQPRANAQNVDGAGWNLEGTPATIIVRPDFSEVEQTINGSTDPAVFPASEVVDIVFQSKQGDDLVRIKQMLIEGDISVDTGPGDDTVLMASNQADGDLSIDTRQGDDFFEGIYTSIGGDLDIETRQGNDHVQFFYENSVRGDYAVSMGQGDDVFFAFLADIRYFFGGDMDINMGEGNDEVGMTYGASEIFVAGDLRIDLGNGDDSLELFGETFPGFPGLLASGTTHIGGNLIISAGNGDDLISIDSLIIARDLSLSGGPGENGPLSDNVIGDSVAVGGETTVQGF